MSNKKLNLDKVAGGVLTGIVQNDDGTKTANFSVDNSGNTGSYEFSEALKQGGFNPRTTGTVVQIGKPGHQKTFGGEQVTWTPK